MRNHREHITTTYEWVRKLSTHFATASVSIRGGKTVINWRF